MKKNSFSLILLLTTVFCNAQDKWTEMDEDLKSQMIYATFDNAFLDYSSGKPIYRLILASQDYTKLPEDICKIKTLREFQAPWNRIHELPDCFAELENLQYLNLHWNYFKQFPPQICKLKKLKFLHFSGIGIKNLPDELGDLKNLETLNLDGFNFEEFPLIILELTKLKHLVITDCKLKSIPRGISQLKNLESIYLGSNKLKDLPNELFEIKTLEYVNIEHNLMPMAVAKEYNSKEAVLDLNDKLLSRRKTK